MPERRAVARSPCSTLCISAGLRKRSAPPSSGTRKPKPSGCPCTVPLMKSSLAVTQSSPLRFISSSPSRCIASMRPKNASRARLSTSISRARSAGGSGTPAAFSASRIATREGSSAGSMSSRPRRGAPAASRSSPRAACRGGAERFGVAARDRRWFRARRGRLRARAISGRVTSGRWRVSLTMKGPKRKIIGCSCPGGGIGRRTRFRS